MYFNWILNNSDTSKVLLSCIFVKETYKYLLTCVKNNMLSSSPFLKKEGFGNYNTKVMVLVIF